MGRVPIDLITPLFSRRVLWASLLLLSGWIIAGCLRMSWQPLLMDEMDFIIAARAWPQHGAAVPHPPGYVHLLRLLFSVFGERYSVARIPGIVSAVAALWILPRLVRSVFSNHPQRDLVALISVWLFALSPLTLQNAMLVDIDNTLMTPMLLILFMSWIEVRRQGGWKKTAGMGIWIALLLWVKFPPVLLFLVGAGVDALWQRDLRRLWPLILAALLGVSLFALTFGLEAWWTGFGLAELRGTFQKASLLFQWHRILLTLPQTTGVFAMWLTLPLSILAAAGVVRALTISPRFRAGAASGVAWFIVVAAVFYSYINGPSYGFPKYQSILLPYVCLLAAFTVLEAWRASPKWIIGVAVVVLGTSLIVQLMRGDPLYGFYRGTAETSVSELRSRSAEAGGAALAASVPALVAVLVAMSAAFMARVRFSDIAMVALGATFLGQAGVTQVVQARAEYSTRYHYGADISDYLETCRRLEASLATGSYMIAPKDVLYRTGFRGRFVNEILREDLQPDSLLAVMGSEDVRALVLTPREETRARATLQNPQVTELLERDFTLERVGEYALFLRKF
jgi:dolichyl-phosphate-mannose-protein mannosyltransferase